MIVKMEQVTGKVEECVESLDNRNIGSCFDATGKNAKDKPDSSSKEDSDNEEYESLETLRKNNIKKMAAIMNSLRNSELEKQFKSNICTGQSVVPRTKKVRKQNVPSMCSKIKIAGETRKSARLRNMIPSYFEDDLDASQKSVRSLYLKRPNYEAKLRTLYFKAPNYSIEDFGSSENVGVGLSSRKSGFYRKEEERIIIPVEEVTQDMLENIAVRVKDKVYSRSGTTCHQCRQKTLDQKTCCRNSVCVGIQGMFCGVCIKNRYGENCADALLNPDWICPVCRGKCNCSICRNRQGKRPTGVLTPLAHYLGYESVDHFLTERKGEGDRPEEDHKWAFTRDPEAVLGFSDAGRKTHLQNGETHSVCCRLCAIRDCDDSENLLGFSNDGNHAIMGGRMEAPLFFF